MRAFVVAMLLVALAGGVAAAQTRAAPMKADARVHFDRGLRLYQKRQYDDAIAELRAALAIDPQPDILYALGQAERRRGNCERAVEYYSSCLALVKDPAAAAVKVQIERCQVTSGENKSPPATDESVPEKEERADLPSPTVPAPTVTPPPSGGPAEAAPSEGPPPPVNVSRPAAPRKPRPVGADPLGATLTAVGIGGVAAGSALVGIASARLDDAAQSYQQYSDARSAPALWIGGVVSLAVGGALIVGGTVRYVIVGARRHPPVNLAGAF